MLGGCASKGQVREEVSRLSAEEAKLARLESELVELEIAIAQADAAMAASQGRFEEAQATTAQAAEEAGRAEASAEGGLMGEPVFRLDGLRFEPGTTALTDESKILLDQLADRLRAEDVAYYVEIQTPEASAPGGELAAARADEVRRYLHVDRGLPLHAVGMVAGPLKPGPADPVEETRDEVLEVLPEQSAAADPQLAIQVVRAQPKS